MLFRGYNNENRNLVVLNSEAIEDIDFNGVTIDRIKKILRIKYRDKILDDPPYHYILTKNGVFELKPVDLAHSDDGFLGVFNDDIRILVIGGISTVKVSEGILSELIADVSIRYGMRIKDKIIFINDKQNGTYNTCNIQKLSIINRNNKNKIFSIYEDVSEDIITINKDVILVSNRKRFISLQEYSNRYLLNIELLKCLNPHVNSDALLVTDLIFLPAITSIIAPIIASSCEKDAEYIYRRCKFMSGKEAGVVND